MRKRTGSVASAESRRMRRHSSMPVIPGRFQSRTTRSYADARTRLEGLLGARRRPPPSGPRRRASRRPPRGCRLSSSTSSTRAFGPCAKGSLVRQWAKLGRPEDARPRTRAARIGQRGLGDGRRGGTTGAEARTCSGSPPRRTRLEPLPVAPLEGQHGRRPGAAAEPARRRRPWPGGDVADLEDGEHPLPVVTVSPRRERELLVSLAQRVREGPRCHHIERRGSARRPEPYCAGGGRAKRGGC